jgi:beta-lactamase regulating signal transducer with metallopeptidase domain/Ca2+-binding EF-hand superfamily protein
MDFSLLSTNSWHETIAVVLLHFLWQGCAVAAIVELAVRGLRIQHGAPRYAAYLTAFLLLAACPAITFAYLVAAIQAPLAVDDALPALAEQAMSWPQVSAVVRPYAEWITVLWLAGVAVLSLRFVGGVWGLHRVRGEMRAVPGDLLERASRIAQRLGVRAAWTVRSSASVLEPMTFGWLRPIVVVPISLLTAEPPDIIDAVLAHELAHIRRYDLWVNALQRLVESVLFFHPVVWWMSRQVRRERELCCDDMAVRLTGAPLVYATALERVASQRVAWSVAPLAVAMGAGALHYRVRRVLGMTDAVVADGASVRLLAAGAALVGVVLLATGGEWFGEHAPRSESASGEVAMLASGRSTHDDATSRAIADQPLAPVHEEPAIQNSAAVATLESDGEHVENAPIDPHSDKPTLKLFDLNRDGVLDDAERKAIETAYASKMQERTRQLLAMHDTNGDGALDESEKAAAWAKYRKSPHRHGTPHRRPKSFAHTQHERGASRMHLPTPTSNRHANRPGSRERHEEWRKAILAKYDANRDGSLDENERNAMHLAWKERRKEQWKGFIERYDVDGDGRIDEHERMAIHLARVRASRVERNYPGST